jgi:hypothetical protein
MDIEDERNFNFYEGNRVSFLEAKLMIEYIVMTSCMHASCIQKIMPYQTIPKIGKKSQRSKCYINRTISIFFFDFCCMKHDNS